MKKIVLITEFIGPPYDEGIKKTVYNIFLELDKNYYLKVICRYGFKKDNIHIVSTNSLYYSTKIKQIIKIFNPDTLIYLPFQSSTFASYLRLKILSGFCKNAKTVFIALQPKTLKDWHQFLIKFIKPTFALTPSPDLEQYWKKINVTCKLIPLLTDLSVFKAIENGISKQNLRKKYNLPIDAFIISHMGHLNHGRNLRSLIPLQKAGFQLVVVSSSSTPLDAMGKISLKDELLNSGIIILEGYIERIEEIYQLSDIYIFPVVDKNGSIGMPLSILEARACAIPVVTTNYGSIMLFLKNDFGGIIYSNPDNFLREVNNLTISCANSYDKTKIYELNNLFYEIIHNQI